MALPDPVELRGRVPAQVASALDRALGLGFVGPAERSVQIEHALGFVLAVERERPGGPATALDLGSGGGLPGLVLGACWPGCRVTLVDASRRRTDFLRREVADLGWLDHVDVVRGRAEDLGRDTTLRERFEVVAARSFGPPAVTAECGSPFALPGGLMVVSEPPSQKDHERWPEEGLAQLELEDLGALRVDERFGYRVLGKLGTVSDRFPRRSGVPAKRPLF